MGHGNSTGAHCGGPAQLPEGAHVIHWRTSSAFYSDPFNENAREGGEDRTGMGRSSGVETHGSSKDASAKSPTSPNDSDGKLRAGSDEHSPFSSASTPLADVLAVLAKAAGNPDAPELRPFTKLRVLDLHSNALSRIPVELKLCAANLRSLILHSNELVSLPDEVVNLSGLRTLDVHDNKIARLPEKLADLHNLTYLDISRNVLRCLPPDFDKVAERLVRLYLHGNPLDGEEAAAGWRQAVERAELVAFRTRGGPPAVPQQSSAKATSVNFDTVQRTTGAPLTGFAGRASPRGKRAPPSKAILEARRAEGKPCAHGLELELGEEDKTDEAAGETLSSTRGSSADLSRRSPEAASPAPVQLPSAAAAGLAGIMKSGLAGGIPTLRRMSSVGSDNKENGDSPDAEGKGRAASPRKEAGVAARGEEREGDAKALPSPEDGEASPKKPNAVSLTKQNSTGSGNAAPTADSIPPWKRELLERKAKAAAGRSK